MHSPSLGIRDIQLIGLSEHSHCHIGQAFAKGFSDWDRASEDRIEPQTIREPDAQSC